MNEARQVPGPVEPPPPPPVYLSLHASSFSTSSVLSNISHKIFGLQKLKMD